MPTNLERMIRLADEVFDTKHDPGQITVTEGTLERLRAIHPATVTGEETDAGPIAWMLVIPTTHEIMELFLDRLITEREILDRTPEGGSYDSVYLCSALVLPEYREKGVARRLVLNAIRSILHEHPIRALFFWPFSEGGDKLARSVATELRLPLYRRRQGEAGIENSST